MHMDMPGVGVSCIIIKGKDVLIGRRKGAHGAGTWAFPGGHLEMYETPEETAIREVLEETGLIVRDPKFGALTNDIFRDDKRHYITLHYVCRYASGDPKTMEPDKCSGWVWAEWNDLPRPLFPTVSKLLDMKFDPFRV